MPPAAWRPAAPSPTTGPVRFKTGLLVGLAVGYYYGAKAGRERFVQLDGYLAQIRSTDAYQELRERLGDLAVEGISLTIADFDGETISIAILPLTYWRTNLHTLAVGAPVNVEADVLVKLAHAQLMADRKPTLDLSEAWLVASGY